jgi:hypothetical protein
MEFFGSRENITTDVNKALAAYAPTVFIVRREGHGQNVVLSRVRVVKGGEEEAAVLRLREERSQSTRYAYSIRCDASISPAEFCANIERLRILIASHLYFITHPLSVPEVFNLRVQFTDHDVLYAEYSAFDRTPVSAECSLASARLALTPVQRLQVAAVHRGYNLFEAPAPWGEELFRLRWAPLAGTTDIEALEMHARLLAAALDTLEALVPLEPERRSSCTVRYEHDAFVFERHENDARPSVGTLHHVQGHRFPMETHSEALDYVAIAVAELRREYAEEDIARYRVPPVTPALVAEEKELAAFAQPPPTPTTAVSEALATLSVEETIAGDKMD